MFLKPRWIVSHLFVGLLIASFIAAGLWQVDRLQLRQDQNALVASRIDAVPTPIETVVGLEPGDAEYRPVQVSGRYAPEREIFVANRSDEGEPGFWAWTVFVADSGGELIVNRGFVNRSIVVGGERSESIETTRAVAGAATIRGLIRRGIVSGRLSSDRSEISRPDADLAASALEIEPIIATELFVELIAQEPSQPGAMPRPVPAPELSDGPHRSYAFQWFTFATLGALGYGLVLGRIRRGDQSRGDVPLDV